MRLEQAIPPPAAPRAPSPALRGTSPTRQGTNLVSRRNQDDLPRSEPFRFLGGPEFSAWEARGMRRQTGTSDRQARSLSPRAIERPEQGGARSRTPPALEPAPLRAHKSSRSRSHLMPSDAEQITPQYAAQSSPQQSQYSFQPSSSPNSSYSPRSAPSPAISTGSMTPPAEHQREHKHANSFSAALSHTFSLHTRQPSRGREPLSRKKTATAPNTMSTSAPPPPPKNDNAGANDLAKIGAPRKQSTQKPRKHVPSMCDYLSLEQLEDMWCAQDQYGGSVITPQKPRGISLDKILEARAMMPEEGLGVHPALRGHALVN